MDLTKDEYNSPLDPAIRDAVVSLRRGGVETFESCQGGDGHAYPEPTVRFFGDQSEGFRALSVASRAGLRVASIRRTWPVIENEPTGPWWEMTFRLPVTSGASEIAQMEAEEKGGDPMKK